jgi:hypothetical protein
MADRPHPASAPHPPAAVSIDLLVAASRERTAILSGFLAGVCVFFVPMAVLAVGLLAAYVAYFLSDGSPSAPAFGAGRAIEAQDFRAVFRPAITDTPLMVCAGLMGGMLAQFRRWLALRAEPAALAIGRRPFLPEFISLYVTLVAATLVLAAVRGGWPQVHRIVDAAPIFLLFMVCAAWLAHAIWQYCFRNILDLLASRQEHEAATELRVRARLPRIHGRRA